MQRCLIGLPKTGVTLQDFNSSRSGPALVFVYKIHGSVNFLGDDFDNIVISDHDYINYIESNGGAANLVPEFVKSRFSQSRFLCLGYSFSDWNIQSLFKRLIRPAEEGEIKDVVVIKSFDPNYDVFLREQDLNIVITTLDRFVKSMERGSEGDPDDPGISLPPDPNLPGSAHRDSATA
jgi:hypothetical protein